jgi:hypothetical protein
MQMINLPDQPDSSKVASFLLAHAVSATNERTAPAAVFPPMPRLASFVWQQGDEPARHLLTSPTLEQHMTTRIEKDFLGEKVLPDSAYYGVQTLRGKENFHITGIPMSNEPYFVMAFG